MGEFSLKSMHRSDTEKPNLTVRTKVLNRLRETCNGKFKVFFLEFT